MRNQFPSTPYLGRHDCSNIGEIDIHDTVAGDEVRDTLNGIEQICLAECIGRVVFSFD